MRQSSCGENGRSGGLWPGPVPGVPGVAGDHGRRCQWAWQVERAGMHGKAHIVDPLLIAPSP